MRRNLRNSTVAKSDNLKAKLKRRELDSARRRSRRLIRQAEENQASIQEALELSVVGQSSDRELDSGDKSDTSAKDTTTTEEDIGAVSSDDFWYDTSNQELIRVDVSLRHTNTTLIN